MVLSAGEFHGERSHRREVSGFSLVESAYAPGAFIPTHSHENAFFSFVVRGDSFEETSGGRYARSASTLVFHPKGEPHANRWLEDGGSCLHVEIGMPKLEEILKAEISLAGPARFSDGRVCWLGSQLLWEFRRSDAAAGLAIEGLTLEILSEIARKAETSKAGDKPPWLLRVRDLISDRFMEPITLAEVAKEVGVHPAHLASTYRRYFGMTVGDQIRRRRVESAKHLLEHSNTPICEIALECGFADQSHFGKVYRQMTGTTPAESRRLFFDSPKHGPTSKS